MGDASEVQVCFEGVGVAKVGVHCASVGDAAEVWMMLWKGVRVCV